ncbi:MAG: hypothetical protein QE263_08515 [Vampirovibrionales bacterium]|nr:hypothetical protein [Vampirovibrionales bacterium]
MPDSAAVTTFPKAHSGQTQPLLDHLEFLLHLAHKLGATSTMLRPFPNITLAVLEAEIEDYNSHNRHQPVNTKTLADDYEVLKQACLKDGGPLYQGNASNVTLRDVIQQSLAHIQANKEPIPNHYVV